MRKKRQSYRKTRVYFEELTEPVELQRETEVSHVDLHLYKLGMYVKFSSLVTQLVIDFVLGLIILFIVFNFPNVFFDLTNRAGSFMHLEKLQDKIVWLLEFPAGFKPNANLGMFLGNFVLLFIQKMSYLTSALRQIKLAIVIYVSLFGCLGFSIQLAAINDVLVLLSLFFVVLYSIFAGIYAYFLSMMGTLTRLFAGIKFNVLRKRNDANNFSVSELFMGVLIITLGIFLLPTVAIFYYYAFVTIILSVLAL